MSLASTNNTNPSIMNEQQQQQQQRPQQQQQQQQQYQPQQPSITRNDIPRIRPNYHFQNGNMNSSSIGIVGSSGGNYSRGILYDPTQPQQGSNHGLYQPAQQLPPSLRRPPPQQQYSPSSPSSFQATRPYIPTTTTPTPIVQPPPQYQILQERQQPMLHPQQQQHQPWLPGNNNNIGREGEGGSSSSSSSSLDLQDSNEANNTLDTFILDLLKKPAERIFLLKLEKDLEQFINNHQMYRLDLPQMNSYQRLMVHKVAPYFNLSHFAEPIRKSVFLCKNPRTAIPEVGFAKLVEPEEKEETQSTPKFKIMRRESPNSQNGSRRGSPNSAVDRKNMTYEERKAAYEEARARIFKDLEQRGGDNNNNDTIGTTGSNSNGGSPTTTAAGNGHGP